MFVYDLPNELIILILDNIRDNTTYINSRSVCKLWYIILRNVKEFENDIHTNNTYFLKNKYLTLDLNKTKIKEINFLDYGNYCFKKYEHTKLVLEIKNILPNKIQTTIYDHYGHTIKTYNVITEETTTRKYNNFPPFNCVIS